MASSQSTSRLARFGKFAGVTALGVSGAAATVYAVNRWRRSRKTQDLWQEAPNDPAQTADPDLQAAGATVSEEPVTDVEDLAPQHDTTETSADAEDVSPKPEEDFPETLTEPAESTEWETWTVEELYQLAQQHDIAGRSSMRKAELIEALQEKSVKGDR